jgi:hypothetical protein
VTVTQEAPSTDAIGGAQVAVPRSSPASTSDPSHHRGEHSCHCGRRRWDTCRRSYTSIVDGLDAEAVEFFEAVTHSLQHF